jgi:hypothetical protein
LRVAVDQSRETPSAAHLASKGPDAHAVSGAIGHIHQHATEPTVAVEERIHSDESFIPDRDDLHRSAVVRDLRNRTDTLAGEVDHV